MEERKQLSPEKDVWRSGKIVERPAKPWSPSVQRFLSFLEERNLPVPHPLGITDGIERIGFIEGSFVHPQKWSDEALYEVGRLTARFHAAGQEFRQVPHDCWQPWCLRELGGEPRICCHGDIAPWNMVTENGMPKALIDWEYAGPLDPLTELARICWLFPQLVDDDLAQLYALPSPEKRAGQVRLICEGYGLSQKERLKMTERILEAAICETAHEAIDPSLTFESEGSLWGFAWRTRSVYWIWRHCDTIRRELEKL